MNTDDIHFILDYAARVFILMVAVWLMCELVAYLVLEYKSNSDDEGDDDGDSGGTTGGPPDAHA